MCLRLSGCINDAMVEKEIKGGKDGYLPLEFLRADVNQSVIWLFDFFASLWRNLGLAWLVDGRRNEGWRMVGRLRRNSRETEIEVGLGSVETRGRDDLGRVLVDLEW